MGFTAAGISPTTVTTTQQAPLGFVLTVPDGDNGLVEYMYCYNDSGSEIGANLAVIRKAATVQGHIAIAATGAQVETVLGITQTAIANGSYGFVARKGIVTATCDAAVTATHSLIVDGSTPGNVTFIAGHASNVVGFGSTLAGRADAGTLSVYIDCRG